MAGITTEKEVIMNVAKVLPAALAISLFAAAPAGADRLDELSLDRWAKLREVERYQLNIAEKYYREKNYKVAAAEYEKFLTLYETSEGAAYSQLKWSLCQVQLKKHNTAIKEGFQSVVDYWPDAPEAVAATYFIGQAYKDIGEIRKAKKAYQLVLEDYPKHLAAVYATVDLIDLTTISRDEKARVQLWKRLTFETTRSKEAKNICVQASQQLATWSFEFGSFEDGINALESTYAEEQMPEQIRAYAGSAAGRLLKDDKTQKRGLQVIDTGVTWIRTHLPEIGTTDQEKQLARSQYYAMVDLQAVSGREQKVREIYDDILKKFGASDETLLRLGNWYKTTDRWDAARQQFQKFEDRLEGQNQVAQSYRQQQNYQAAVAAYQKNVAADTENPTQWTAQIAGTWVDAKKYPEAIAVYTELLKSDPENTEKWMWQIATCHRYAGKYREAIGFYRQCNNFPTNYQEMASCHRALKEYNEAVILYNQIVGGAPKSAPWAMLQIGYTYEKAGKKESAIRTFQQVCRNYPKDRYASQAHAHLQNQYKITVTLGGAADK
tara:strand:+ start:167 stop:1816 length:1650 start_codon:yes stop_codon:yes gene_type:complete